MRGPSQKPSSKKSILLAKLEARFRFANYAEYTTGLKLHGWQHHLCDVLQSCLEQRGQRILIHGPPQFGKSILLSKRFPAWYVAHRPDDRVVVAAYNLSHAESLTSAVRDTLKSPAHQEIFATELAKPASEGEFSTTLRRDHFDGQPSVRAVGLLSGFTGTGADLLLIDDPYASPDDARSEAINERVWRWWKELASVRISEETNVIVMFHRYHQDDLAGRLMAEGGWRSIRFPALADDNPDGDDPTGRAPGEPLSPIRSLEWILEQRQKNPITFAGQFQGRPISDEGALFNRNMFQIIAEAPPIRQWYRGYDLATSVRASADYSASVKIGIDTGGDIILADAWRGRLGWPEMRQHIIESAQTDRDTYIGIEDKSIGLAMVQELQNPRTTPQLANHSIVSMPVRGDKKQRASGWAARAKEGRLKLVRGEWNQRFIDECLRFTGAGDYHDDQVDAFSIAWALAFKDQGSRHIEKPTQFTAEGKSLKRLFRL